MATAAVEAVWAHPRSRGENLGLRHARVEMEGSSPLTRGKHPDARVAWTSDGLIPAHAGKTLSEARFPTGRRAHPRSRGENAPHADNPGNDAGSSPLTRGKHIGDDRLAEAWRLIPAHAGKTILREKTPKMRWAHPRSRGENRPPRRVTWSPNGSSPLTRGKLVS